MVNRIAGIVRAATLYTLAGLALFVTGYAVHGSPAAPAAVSCPVQAVPGHQVATAMRAGDASSLWLPGAHRLATFVCGPDGSLVPAGQAVLSAAVQGITRGHGNGWAHVEQVPATVRAALRLGHQRALMLVTPRETYVITYAGKVYRS